MSKGTHFGGDQASSNCMVNFEGFLLNSEYIEGPLSRVVEQLLPVLHVQHDEEQKVLSDRNTFLFRGGRGQSVNHERFGKLAQTKLAVGAKRFDYLYS